jgi:hypothetical protein
MVRYVQPRQVTISSTADIAVYLVYAGAMLMRVESSAALPIAAIARHSGSQARNTTQHNTTQHNTQPTNTYRAFA